MNTQRRSFWAILIIGLLILGLVGCAPAQQVTEVSEAPAQQAPEAPETSAEPIRIGYHGALSGPAASLGDMQLKGVSFAVEEINSEGGVLGRPLRLYSADNACTPDGGVSSTRELAELQRVKALLGAGCSGPTLSSLPLLIEFGIPQVTIGSTNLQITEEGNPWEFRVNANDETFAQAFSKFIAGEVSTVSLLVLNNEYGLGSEDAFRRYLDELGVEVLGSEYFERGQADYRSALTSIKAQNPEGLIFIGAAADGNIFFRQFRELGMNQKVYTRGAVSAELADLIADDPSLAEGAKDVTYYGTGGNPEFDERFRARWGVLPTFSAGAAYCGTVVLADAIERAGSDDSVAIRDALKTTDYDCTDILGPIKFDEKGQAKSHIYITGMEAGKIIVVDVIKDY